MGRISRAFSPTAQAQPLYVSHAGGAGSAGAGGARGEREGGDYLTPVRIASGCLSAF
eukprot:COSAG04_NODE_11568_length_701_cov_1.541528_1_plen_56_part_01